MVPDNSITVRGGVLEAGDGDGGEGWHSNAQKQEGRTNIKVFHRKMLVCAY